MIHGRQAIRITRPANSQEPIYGRLHEWGEPKGKRCDIGTAGARGVVRRRLPGGANPLLAVRLRTGVPARVATTNRASPRMGTTAGQLAKRSYVAAILAAIAPAPPGSATLATSPSGVAMTQAMTFRSAARANRMLRPPESLTFTAGDGRSSTRTTFSARSGLRSAMALATPRRAASVRRRPGPDVC